MLAPLKRVASIPLAIAVLIYDAADAVLSRLFRPTISWLASLTIFSRIGSAIAALPPYAILVMLAVPFAVIEPFKLIGLYWMAAGHFKTGLITLALAHLLSFFICERIFHVGKDKLLTIGWFGQGYRFLIGLRDEALAWVRSTAAWRSAAAAVAWVSDHARRALRA